jgi:hypothetical protein
MKEIQRKDIAQPSRNQRSADSFVRERSWSPKKLADKAVRAPEESSQNATKLGDSTAKMQSRKEIRSSLTPGFSQVSDASGMAKPFQRFARIGSNPIRLKPGVSERSREALRLRAFAPLL